MKQILGIALLALICSCGKNGNCSTMPAESKKCVQDKNCCKKESGKSSWDFIETSGWKLIQLNGKLVTEFNPTIQFEKGKSTMAGSTGCNRYFGTFSSEANTITFTIGGSTMMMCPEAAMTMEQAYSDLLKGKSYTFDLADQVLNFYDNGTLVMMFGRTDKE